MTGGAKFDTEHAGFTGTGFVSGIQTAGASSVKVDVNAAKAGDYRHGAALRQRPEPVPGPEEADADRQRHEPPDHAAVDRHVEDVGLLPRHGRAQRRARTRSSSSTTTGDDGNVNLDSLRLAPAGTTRYEAEAATLAGGANAQTEHAGLQRPRLRRRLPEPGREHDVQGQPRSPTARRTSRSAT